MRKILLFTIRINLKVRFCSFLFCSFSVFLSLASLLNISLVSHRSNNFIEVVASALSIFHLYLFFFPCSHETSLEKLARRVDKDLPSLRFFKRLSLEQSIGYYTPRLFYSKYIYNIFISTRSSSLSALYRPDAFRRSRGKLGLAASVETSNESDSIERRENITGEGMAKRNRYKEENKRLTVM